MITSKLAVLFDAPRGKFQIDEKPVPDPAPGKCVIKTELTGVCATDVHYWMGMGPTSPFPIPAMLGHEFCGTIHALGEGLETDRLGNPLKIGDRVMVKPTLSCGECIWCTYYNDPTNCLHGAVYGASDYKDPFIHGGYSQYMYLFYPGSEIYRTELPPEAACMFEPFSIGVNAVMNSTQKIGDTIVVQGAGPIGMLTMAAAKYYGAGKCIMVGGPEERLELAKEFGADITLNILDVKDPDERIKIIKEHSLYGLGVDRVYECAGVPGAVSEAIQFLRTGGELVEVGHFADAGTIEINPAYDLCAKKIRIIGSWASPSDIFVRTAIVMESRKFPVEKLITHKVGLDEITEAYGAMASDFMLWGKPILKAAVEPWK